MNQYTNNTITREQREQHFIERLNKKYPTFEYVSGYVNSECNVLLKCKKCGELLTKKSSCIRGKRNLTCFNCKKNETIKNKELNKTIKRMLEQQRVYMIKVRNNKRKELYKIYLNFKANTLYIKECKCCNSIYIEHTKSIYCAKCRKRIGDKHSNKSLKELYKRDKGICYLCNKLCDWNDKKEINGTIIVGNCYPSIDHVIPLCKGGTDEWNNLKLAHFICNTRKREKILN